MPNSRWSLKELNKPYEEDGLYKIVVRSDNRAKDGMLADYASTEVLLKAIELAYDYYGKLDIGPRAISPIITTESAIAGQFSPRLTVQDFFVDGRPNSAAKLLVTFDKGAMDAYPEIQPAILPTDVQRHISTLSLGQNIKKLKGLFTDYHNTAKFFDGKISPHVNFLKEHQRLELWYEALTDMVEMNGYKIREDEDDTIILTLSSNYELVYAEMLQSGIDRPLTRGFKYFKSKTVLGNPRTNALALNVKEMMSIRKRPPSWSQFLQDYIISGKEDATIKIMHSGRPRTDKMSEILADIAKNENKLFQSAKASEEEKARIREDIATGKIMFNEAASEKEENIQQSLSALAEKMRKVNSAKKLVSEVIMKYGIDNLISAGLECLMLRTGIDIPDLPDIPGISPFEKPTPPKEFKLPKFPTELPTFDPTVLMARGIKEALKGALDGAIKAMISAVADIITDLCADTNYGETEPISLAVAGNLSPIETGKGPGALDSCYQNYSLTTGEGTVLIDAVSDVLSPIEVCDLLNMSPSSSVLETITDIVEQQNLKMNFMTDEDIIDFFGCLGDLIDPSYCDAIYNPPILPSDVDPCLFEDQLVDALNDTDLFNDLNDLLDLINNNEQILDPIDICATGIVPPFSGMPTLVHSLGSALDASLMPAQTSFINDVSGIKSLYLIVDPKQPNAELIEELIAAEAIKEQDDEDERERRMGHLNNFLAIDAFAGQEDIANVTRLIEAGNAAIMASAQYSVVSDFKRKLERIETDIITPFDASVLNIEDWTFSVNSGSKKIHYGAPDMLLLEDTIDSENSLPVNASALDFSTQASPSVLKQRDATSRDFSNIIHDAIATLASAPANNADVTADLSNKQYFNLVLSMLRSAAHGITKSPLFESDNFRKFALVPVPCQDGTELNSGDLLDLENIKNSALQDFFQGTCLDGEFEVGPVEDAMLFATTNVYIQVYVIEQLIKNLFLFNVYGTAEILSDPMLVQQMVRDIKSGFSMEAERISPEDPESVQPSLHTTIEELSIIYVRKLIAAPIEGQIPDLINEGEFIQMAPENVTADFALEYIVQKRLIDASETIGTILSSGAVGSFGAQYLAYGIPTCDLWMPATEPTEDHPTLRTTSGGQNTEGLTYKFLKHDPVNSMDPEQAPDIYTNIGFDGDIADYISDKGALANERYVTFDFDSAAFDALSPFEQLLTETLISVNIPAEHIKQTGNIKRYTTSFDEFTNLLRMANYFHAGPGQGLTVNDMFENLPPITLKAPNANGISTKQIRLTQDNYEQLRFMSNLISDRYDGGARVGGLRVLDPDEIQYQAFDMAEELGIPESFWSTPRIDWVAPKLIDWPWWGSDNPGPAHDWPASWSNYNLENGEGDNEAPQRIYLTPPIDSAYEYPSGWPIYPSKFVYKSGVNDPAEIDPDASQPAGLNSFWRSVEDFPDFLRHITMSQIEDILTAGGAASTTNILTVGEPPPVPLALLSIFENIKIGTRLVYYTGYRTFDDLYNSGYFNLYAAATPEEQETKWIEDRIGLPIKGRGPNYVFPIDLGVKSEIGILSNLTSTVSSPGSFIHTSFENLKKDLYEGMTATTAYRNLFVLPGLERENAILPAKQVIAFLALLGQAVNSDKATEINKIFDDTKLSLRFVLRALLAGNDFAYEDPENRTSAQAARDAVLNITGAGAAPFAQMGASFIIKMLIEAPKMILKGLAELVDPHVVIGNMIKNISGTALTQIPSSLPFEELLDLIQGQIDRQAESDLIPPPLVPQVRKTGIDLVGKLPLLFLIPPTPLGLAYILLNMNLEDLIPLPDCETEEE